jgi:hypothetical protein
MIGLKERIDKLLKDDGLQLSGVSFAAFAGTGQRQLSGC